MTGPDMPGASTAWGQAVQTPGMLPSVQATSCAMVLTPLATNLLSRCRRFVTLPTLYRR